MAPAFHRLLPEVFTTEHLPEAELSVLFSSGELTRLGSGYVRVFADQSPRLRALSIRHRVDNGWVVDLRSAAWIHGALSVFRPTLNVCAPTQCRSTAFVDPPYSFRQVVLRPSSIVNVAGVSVTTPRQTILDLARSEGSGSLGIINRLVAIAGLDLAEISAEFETAARARQPNVRRARRVLADALLANSARADGHQVLAG